ncbi:MAG: hypothetical protein OXE58_13045 [Acidobacteria bacterium]|nr:hypothetical protein [Acidobacteriota bacterium]
MSPDSSPAARDRGVLGLDEAGRGAALGPLVVAGVVLDPLKAGALTRLGVRDSKRFGAGDAARTHRKALAWHIERLAECIVVRVLDAGEVDRYAEVGDLNVLERRAADEILGEAGTVHRVVADGRRLFEALRPRYPHLEAVDDGESHHVAVAAASVIAKVRRDALLDALLERYEAEYGEVKGGGYVNAATERFLRAYHGRTGRLPPETRMSWSWDVIRELRGAPRLF